MSEVEERPVVTRITGECVREGTCERCGGHVRRRRSIVARSLDDLNDKVEAWDSSPLLHARCEQHILAEGS